MREKIFHKEYFTLPELAHYSGLGIRFLRDALKDPEYPLPHFRINKKTIIVSRTEFNEWLEIFRDRDDNDDLNQVFDQVMTELSNRKPRLDKSELRQ